MRQTPLRPQGGCCLGGFRSMLAVPVSREGVPIGFSVAVALSIRLLRSRFLWSSFAD